MSLITSQQLVDALVVVKTEQSKVECQQNLTISLENAKKRQYDKRVAKVNLLEINENGVIKKIMFPVDTIINTKKKTGNKSKVSPKLKNVSSVNNNVTRSVVPNGTLKLSTTSTPSLVPSLTSAPKAQNGMQNVLNISMQFSQPNLANRPIILNGLSGSSNAPNSQTFIFNNPQANCNFNVNGMNQFMLSQSPVIINQPIVNQCARQNVVIQPQNNQPQIIQLQNNNIINNNGQQCWRQNLIIQPESGRQLIQLPNNFRNTINSSNNNAIQYQIINNQQKFFCNPNSSSNPIIIQPQMSNNAIIMPANHQKSVFLNQTNPISPNFRQPNIITINNSSNNVNQVNSQNIFSVNNIQGGSPLQQQQVQAILIHKSANNTNPSSSQSDVTTNLNSIVSTNNVNAPQISTPQKKNTVIFMRSSVNKSSNIYTTNNEKNKKIAIPRLNITLVKNNSKDKCHNNVAVSNNHNNNVNNNNGQSPDFATKETLNSNTDQVNTNSKKICRQFLKKKASAKSEEPSTNLVLKERTTEGEGMNDSSTTSNELPLNIRIAKSSGNCIEHQMQNSMNTGAPINTVNDHNQLSIINKQVPVIRLNQLPVVSNPQQINNINSKSGNGIHDTISQPATKQHCNAEKQEVKNSTAEAKQLEAMKSYRLIKPKPSPFETTKNIPEVLPKENYSNIKDVICRDEATETDTRDNDSEDKTFCGKRKPNVLDNDLAIARILSKEDNSDGDDYDGDENCKEKIRKGSRRVFSSDKSYKCKNILKGLNRVYPRTRSATKHQKI